MRVGFINSITGTVMEVDESRVEEYKAAGYKLAAKDSPGEPASADMKAVRRTKKPATKK